MLTRLTVTRRLGNVLSGLDPDGEWHDVKVSRDLADRVGQELCYVRSVDIFLVAGVWTHERGDSRRR